ncbi:MAG: hypothetical protein WKF61_08695 [Luteimonas sp.]
MLALAGPAAAISPQEAQRLCDEMTKSAEEARKGMIEIGMPKQDPGKTFENATKSCLSNIAKYKDIFTFKSVSGAAIQQFITQMATQMMESYCQAATAEFDRLVQDAMSQVNSQTRGYVTVSTNGTTINTAQIQQQVQQAAQPDQNPGFLGGLLNWFKGDDGNGGNPGEKTQ